MMLLTASDVYFSLLLLSLDRSVECYLPLHSLSLYHYLLSSCWIHQHGERAVC